MKWRSELVLSMAVLSALLPFGSVVAQAPAGPVADPACACFVKPGTGQDGGDGEGGSLALLGVAGLAVLTALPFGGGMIQGLPFAAGESAPRTTVAAGTAEDPIAGPDAPVAPAAAAAPGSVRSAEASAAPRQLADLAPTAGETGVVPPRTATHLPLFLALGLAMIGGGALLSKRDRRRRRRRLVGF